MSNDAEAQEVNPTVTTPGSDPGPPAGDAAKPSGRVGEEYVADPDAVIIGTSAGAIPEAARPQTPVNGDTGLAGDPERMHERWAAIQSTFVDDPRGSVAAASELVTEAIEALVAGAQEREHGLRGEWDRDGADTEDLRNTLRSYRGLLDRLVTL
jgi:hypothetical protein